MRLVLIGAARAVFGSRSLVVSTVRHRPFSAMASSANPVPREASQGPSRQHQQKRGGKRRFQQTGHSRQKKRERDMGSGTADEILARDIADLLRSQASSLEASGTEESPLPEEGTEVEVEVVELSSTGDGLAQQKGSKQVYVVPFTVPGDVVKVKAFRHMREGYTVGDFISVVKPAPARDDSRINCQYFTKCSGCQFQMLDYAEQLRLKKRVVEKAFQNFSHLPPELIPAIQDTIGSPLQYGYRTKLTPHFDGPKEWRRGNVHMTSRPNIGFTPKTSRATMDIEDCPIGTDTVRSGMKRERQRMDVEFGKYTRGATILLRETTKRVFIESRSRSVSPTNSIKVETDKFTDYKTCMTDNNGMSTEYVDDYKFSNPAGSFFQNNNSILPVFTDYVRQHVLPHQKPDESSNPIKYLIDAYSGSGLFTITLASMFQRSTGIDIDPKSIEFARKNAWANGLPDSQANFIAADARELFKNVTYPADETVVVLDPPRKGCDADFLGQLLQFGPKRVVYVSCNVHTQARDIGKLVKGQSGSDTEGQKVKYEIESLVGFDFFPQTSHVEGVAVLRRVDPRDEGESRESDTAASVVANS